MQETSSEASGLQPERSIQSRFNPFEAIIGAIFQPVSTMRQIAAARPWVAALLLCIGIALLNGVAGLATPMPETMNSAELPPSLSFINDLMLGVRTPAGMAIQVLLVTPILLVLASAVLYLVGRLLRGRGAFTALFSTLVYAEVPSILQAPLIAWLNLIGGLFAAVGGFLSMGFGIWTLVLSVIAVKESMSLSTGRAAAVVLIPLIVMLLAFVAVTIVFIAQFLGAVNPG